MTVGMFLFGLVCFIGGGLTNEIFRDAREIKKKYVDNPDLEKRIQEAIRKNYNIDEK